VDAAIRIRKAQSGDGRELTRVAHAAKRFWGYPEKWIRLWKRDLTVTSDFIRDQPVFCAVRGSTIVGFYGLSGDRSRRELEHFWVDPDAIGAGVGRLLFGHLLRHLRRVGVTKLTIASDPNAEGFYRKLGARRVGTTPSQPAGRRLPLLVVDLRSGKAAVPARRTACKAR
jgi:GNAT superfamily N-acetyltransferase